jgi:hypothetical protein
MKRQRSNCSQKLDPSPKPDKVVQAPQYNIVFQSGNNFSGFNMSAAQDLNNWPRHSLVKQQQWNMQDLTNPMYANRSGLDNPQSLESKNVSPIPQFGHHGYRHLDFNSSLKRRSSR